MNVVTPPEVPELSSVRAARLRHHLLDEIERPHARPAGRRAAIWAPIAAALAVLAVVAGIALRPASRPIETAASRQAAAVRLLTAAAAVAAAQPSTRPGQRTYAMAINILIAKQRQFSEILIRGDNGYDSWIVSSPELRIISAHEPVGVQYDQYELPHLPLSDMSADPDRILALARSGVSIVPGLPPNDVPGSVPIKGLSQDDEAFAYLGQQLRMMVLSSHTNALLLRTAALIPGLRVLPATDIAGRRGVAVARDENGLRIEWIFDAKTHAYLGQRTYLLRGTAAGKKGDVLTAVALLASRVG